MARPATQQDEFEEQAAAAEAVSGYEHTRGGDVEDQREYRQIPAGTETLLQATGFELNTKKAPYIFAKVEVEAPEAWADGSSNFGVRLYVNPIVREGNTQSGWTMTKRQLCWMYAAANQCDAATANKDLFGPVYEQFPNIGPDDVRAFQEAVVAQLNETLKGRSFGVKIGVEPAQYEQAADGSTVLNEDGTPKIKYRSKQTFGTFLYPKGAGK